MILLASLLWYQGRKKNPHFEEEVAALYGKESHLIVVTLISWSLLMHMSPLMYTCARSYYRLVLPDPS
jgi:hypothetical protein